MMKYIVQKADIYFLDTRVHVCILDSIIKPAHLVIDYYSYR